MKKRILHLARTGVLGLALTVVTGCPEAAESVSVPVVSAVAEGDAAAGIESGAAAAPAATPEATPGEVKQQLAPVIPTLSPGLSEIVRLAQAKVGEDVLLAYVARSTFAYNPTTEEIIYLHDLGVSDKVVAEIVKRSPQPEALMAEKKPVATEPLNIPAVKVVTDQPAPGQTLTPLVSTNPGPTYVEQQPVVVQQPVIIEQPIVIQQAPEDVRYFYSSLAPYGSWVDVAGYGWCWQPTVCVTYSDWRPYEQAGRWIYSDCGWYWQSDYSWGWAPFHYGRWFRHPSRGWCWTPDRVWGPAWVSWRTSSAYCGWAPLPPAARYRSGLGLYYNNSHVGISFEFGLGASDYTFVAYNHFYSHNPYNYCLPAAHATRAYHQTTVNNIIIQGNNNNVVINQGGADVTRISKATRVEVQKVSVMDMPAAHRSGVQPDRLVRAGGTLAVYRPGGPGSSVSRMNQEPAKVAVSTSGGRPAGSAVPRNHAPANLHPEYASLTSAPTTALQRYETPKGTELPVLQRPQTVSLPGNRPSVGLSSVPADTGINRPLSPQQPVQPGSISATRMEPYTPPSKRPPEATRPMSTPQPVYGSTVTLSQPKPVYGAPATPSAGRPVQPATPEQARLSPQTPVSSYQAPPTIALRNEPSRPSAVTIPKPGGYNQRPSLQPTFNGKNGSSLPQAAELPRARELPRASELPRAAELPRSSSRPSRQAESYTAPAYTQPEPTYSAPTPSYTRPTQTYSRPTSSYSAPAESPRPSYNPPSQRTYEAPRPTYTAPAARPTYTAPSQPAPHVSLPESRPSVSTPHSSGGNDSRRPGGR